MENRNMYGFTPEYLTKNGRPYFPIMGEFHYSRYPREYWREALLKMKAGGVNIVSTYVFWIHHEEIEGEYDFSGNRDVGAFCRLCGELGMEMVLRIGPWCHGEVRNGGMPDWILKKPYPVRENNAEYFATVKKYYEKIYEQVRGCFLSDGGAIIGVQIENEYGHCGGLTGDNGNLHLLTLENMAKQIGFAAPLYTATGWGGAMTADMLPVMGGYCEAPWDQRLTDIEPSGNYIFTHERNDHNIGSDHRFGTGITFDMKKYPYLTAELGGGMQPTHHRRPVARAEDIGAMSLVKLGSGVNLLGYYMYHGGTNPKGKLTTLQESRETGYLNDLPEYGYDFNAPIKEFGQISRTFGELKLYAMFAKDFGEELCKMKAEIPTDNPLFPTDFTNLRHSVRTNGESGYVFVNNFQRRYKMAAHKDVVLKACDIEFPPVDIKNGDYFFFPFNIKFADSVIEYATATPLCKLNSDTLVFYSTPGIEPVFKINGTYDKNKLVLITREQAKNAYKTCGKTERLIITDNVITEDGGKYTLFSKKNASLTMFPPAEKAPDGFTLTGNDGTFARYEKNISDENVRIDCHADAEGIYTLSLSYPPDIGDCFIRLDYAGDKAKMCIGGELVDDNFYDGTGWTIGMKRYGFPPEIKIEIFPLYESDKIFLETKPPFTDGKAQSINSVTAYCEYETHLIMT